MKESTTGSGLWGNWEEIGNIVVAAAVVVVEERDNAAAAAAGVVAIDGNRIVAVAVRVDVVVVEGRIAVSGGGEDGCEEKVGTAQNEAVLPECAVESNYFLLDFGYD